MLTVGERADVGAVRARLEPAIAFRASLALDATAYRLVHGEADLAAIADRPIGMATTWSCRRSPKAWIGCCRCRQALSDRLHPAASSPGTIRGREAWKGSSSAWTCSRARFPNGRGPRGPIEYQVDLWHGQKTGLFLDQRENREAAARYARGRCSTASAITVGSPYWLGRSGDIAFDIRRMRSRGHGRMRAQRPGVDARVGNVFDELRGLDRLQRALRHHRPRPAGLRQDQGVGREGRRPGTRRSTCGR